MSEKTEQPTPKKLRDARNKGQVAHSKEVVSTFIIIGVFGFFWATWPHYFDELKELILMPASLYDLPFEDAVKKLFDLLMADAVALLVPLLGLVLALGIIGNMIQVGVLFATESIKPDLKKISPAQGIKRIISMKNVIEAIKSIIKITFLGLLIYWVITGSLRDLMKIPDCGLACLTDLLQSLLLKIALYSSGAFIIIAAADFAFQKFQHIKQLKMSKEEIKQEYKEMEGDPHIKGKRRHLQQELLMSGLESQVKKSSVIVTNPTRIAVGLYYQEGETPLPSVTVKGENLIAKRIIEIAKKEGIPIMEHVPLARGLLADGEVNQYIPTELIEPVAEVLRWLRDLAQNDP